ncbi:PD-(D/E)XK motif protein [Vreelandella malpeensis]|uniref:PD-(D/E)XK motif protein n=1 Tax=Vreelandella malpeensis TaxID=1172368 RepID=A0ABS8DT39_9GAMM|nr:PD-(D/E)XK motif protein [Halomonas malpeensis]MCB8889464.1 PD-(D/E)XK motif protein [Halomonas malpeensis]
MSEVQPWNGLGVNEARRVDKCGRHDFFWAVVENDNVALALALPEDAEKVLQLPKIKSLDISYRKLGERDALLVVLRDPEQADLFASLCKDIMSAGEQGETSSDALDRSVRRTLRWHHLLRGGSSERLSVDEQRGLLGELHVLQLLCAEIGTEAAIVAWRGPEGGAKDFELHGMCIEVKSRRGAARPQVQISSADQLADVASADVFLLVYDVDAAIKPEGMTLSDHVHEVELIFKSATLTAYDTWERLLAAAGFDWAHDYSDRRWTVGKRVTFLVEEGFPRIPTPLPMGVLNVKYSVALNACAEFKVEDDQLLANIKKTQFVNNKGGI